MFRIIPFEEIDVQKYNGTVHYSPNGNIYGYHWYLKSVFRTFDVIVEMDYESVLPIIPRKVEDQEYPLLLDLGPYSINPLNEARMQALMALYPQKPLIKFLVSSRASLGTLHQNPGQEYYIIDTIDDYESMRAQYTTDTQQSLDQFSWDDYKLIAGGKPEDLVAKSNYPSKLQNTLMRIMYNGMHRGILFVNMLQRKSDHQLVAGSVWMNSHNKLYELFFWGNDIVHRVRLLDVLLQQQSGKPMQIWSPYRAATLQSMGFSSQETKQVTIGKPWWSILIK